VDRPDATVYSITWDTGEKKVTLHEAKPIVFADLGYGVLDPAMVKTAGYFW
jgi:hypothetical protein